MFVLRLLGRAFGVFVLLGFAGLAFLAWCLLHIPVGGGVAPDATLASIVLESRDGPIFAARGVTRGDAVDPARLPQPLTDAVIAIEDRRFHDHAGLDLRGILRAVTRNLGGDRRVEGASTITQQLARMTYLSPERSIVRKLQEAMLALWLEQRLSKQEILARYLNAAYFGAGAYGADAAARRYFGKAAGELTLAEAATIAGLVRAPSQLAPTRNPEGAQRRAALVLQAMRETGRITAEQAAAAQASPPALQAPPEMVTDRGWFADWAEAETRRLIGPLPVDLATRTTLDPALQDLAQRVVTRALEREGQRLRVGQAALIALGPDGAVLALIGGRDYAASQFNRATQARRQPGSLFKLFTYAAAMEAGVSPDQTMTDQPVTIGNWSPQNYEGGYRGTMTLRQAFAHSVNTIAVQLFQQVGQERVIGMARRLGLRGELPAVPSLALGTGEATLIELTAAFGTVAYGQRIEPWLIQSVRARDRTIYTRPEAPPQPGPLSAQAQQAMLDLMLASVREGTARAARLERPVAGKTGTTQDYRDAWFIGMTADAVVGVWVGNDDNSPMNNVTGGTLPARIWHDFMVEADRAKTRAAPPPAPTAAAPRNAPAIRGIATVQDTGTLRIGGQVVRLVGVVGVAGEPTYQMTAFLAGREVVCEPANAAAYRCRVDGRDLSEVVLSNGGGRSTNEADAALRGAENNARVARRGIWALQ